jgi:class 3 adenylate cyclase
MLRSGGGQRNVTAWEAGMPIYLDRHDRSTLTFENIAEAHQRDLAVQQKYNVRFLTYWFDSAHGRAFCLVDAPDAETANRVHEEAHGGRAGHVIQVDMAAVYAFLGRVSDPEAPGGGAARPRDFDSGYRAIMFTDIAGSTEMTARLGQTRALELVRTHDSIVRAALARTGGREVKHLGDGIMAAFADPSAALEGARHIQRSLAAFNAGSNDPVHVRIGLHAGEPVAEGADLFGTAVQMAARLCDAAEAGAILASRELCDRASVAGEAISLGSIPLKGFAEPVPVYSVGWQ